MKPYLAGTFAAAAVIIAFVAGSQIDFEDDGPIEQAGEELDEAIGAADDAASDAGDKIGDAFRDAGDGLSDAARELSEPVQQ